MWFICPKVKLDQNNVQEVKIVYKIGLINEDESPAERNITSPGTC